MYPKLGDPFIDTIGERRLYSERSSSLTDTLSDMASGDAADSQS